MLIYDNKAFDEESRNNYIALGSFDGLHLGHLSLVRKVKNLAAKNGGKSVVFTFKNPRHAFPFCYLKRFAYLKVKMHRQLMSSSGIPNKPGALA